MKACHTWLAALTSLPANGRRKRAIAITPCASSPAERRRWVPKGLGGGDPSESPLYEARTDSGSSSGG